MFTVLWRWALADFVLSVFELRKDRRTHASVAARAAASAARRTMDDGADTRTGRDRREPRGMPTPMKPARRHATYDDVRDASDLLVAEADRGRSLHEPAPRARPARARCRSMPATASRTSGSSIRRRARSRSIVWKVSDGSSRSSHGGSTSVRAEPFAAIEIDTASVVGRTVAAPGGSVRSRNSLRSPSLTLGGDGMG